MVVAVAAVADAVAVVGAGVVVDVIAVGVV